MWYILYKYAISMDFQTSLYGMAWANNQAKEGGEYTCSTECRRTWTVKMNDLAYKLLEYIIPWCGVKGQKLPVAALSFTPSTGTTMRQHHSLEHNYETTSVSWK
jgi:hypothetical protein